MNKFLQRFRPDHLGGQVAILILVSIIVFHVTLVVAFQFVVGDWKPLFKGPIELTASYILAIDLAPTQERQKILSDLARVTPWTKFAVLDDQPNAIASTRPDPELGSLRAHLWRDAEVFLVPNPSDGGTRTVAIALRKGGYALVSASQEAGPWPPLGPPPPLEQLQAGAAPPAGLPRPPSLFGPLPAPIWLGSALFFFLCATILTIWTSNAVVAPLVKLARQAERFPHESSEGELIAEEGPQEVRDLTVALNRMQARIYSMIAARAQVLAAISHDLRTVITRMRLRAEFIDDETLRKKMLNDADLMDSMLYKNLQHLRSEGRATQRSLVDLDSVLQTVCDQFTDLGHDVAYSGGEHQPIRGSLTDLQRVFSNLIENAVAYAGKATIVIDQPSPDIIQVDVVDEGPGISAQDKPHVIEPFVRGQPARNMNKHVGFGLGLSIVNSLLEEHGGALKLLDGKSCGLIARVILPRAKDEALD